MHQRTLVNSNILMYYNLFGGITKALMQKGSQLIIMQQLQSAAIKVVTQLLGAVEACPIKIYCGIRYIYPSVKSILFLF